MGNIKSLISNALNKDITYISLLLLISVITYWRWFFLDKLFIWGDASFFFRYESLWIEYVNFFHTWSTRANGLGAYNIALGLSPVEFLIGIIVKLFGNLNLALKFFAYIPATLIAPIGSFFLLKEITRNRLSAMVGAIVFSFNVYILLSNIGGHLQISISYSLASVILFLYINYLKSPSRKSMLLVTLVCFISTIYEFRIFYITAWVILFYLLYFIFTNYKSKQHVIKTLLIGGTPMLVLSILTLYWTAPLILSGSAGNNAAINRGLFGNTNMYFAQSLAFFHPFWTIDKGIALEVQEIPLRHWLIPLFAVIGIKGLKKNKFIAFFALITILGIMLTKQSGRPFEGLYLWLYENWPGFNAYREASKFYLLLSLGYSVLIANSINNISEFLSTKRYLNLLTPLIVSIIVSVFLFNTTTIIDGSAKGLTTPKNIPANYIELQNFLSSQNEEYKTLWVPSTSLWSFSNLSKPRIGLYQLYFNYLSSRYADNSLYVPLENKSNNVADINHKTLEILTQSYSDKLLDLLSIKYVIVPGIDEEEDNVFVNYGFPDDRGYILDVLDSLEYLRRIKEIEGIILYENSNYYPQIFASSTEDVEVVNPVNFTRKSSSNYLITISDPSLSHILFSDLYDKNWKLYQGEVSYLKIIFDRNSLQELPHKETFAGTNVFDLENRGDQTVYSLIYIPQIYTDIGTIISLTVLLIITCYFIVIFIKKNAR